MCFGYQVEKTRFRRFGIEEKKRNGSDFFNGKVCLVQNLDFSEKKKDKQQHQCQPGQGFKIGYLTYDVSIG